MDIASSFLPTYTGLSVTALFGATPPLVKIARDGMGVITFPVWNVPNVAKPSDAAVSAALLAAEPVTTATLIAYATQVVTAYLAKAQTFNVATSGAPINILCDGTDTTRTDLALLALYGQQNPTGSKSWVDNNGVTTVLTGTELVTLATLVGNWISDVPAALQTLTASITSTPPTVTTTAQIDAYVWPTA